MKRKHDYATRVHCPNFHPVTAEDPDGWCGCGLDDLNHEIHYKKIALEGQKAQVKDTQKEIRRLERLLARAGD